MPLTVESIGHLKLAEIRPQHLNNFYETLSKNGIRRTQGRATAKRDIKAMLKQRGLTIKKAAELAGVGNNTLSTVCNGGNIAESKAQAIANLLEMPMSKLFNIKRDNTPLSNKTILE